jgi:hypothetical protein
LIAREIVCACAATARERSASNTAEKCFETIFSISASEIPPPGNATASRFAAAAALSPSSSASSRRLWRRSTNWSLKQKRALKNLKLLKKQ